MTFGTEARTYYGVEPFIYKMVARNDHPHKNHDFNVPRLHKMVTEVEPAEYSSKLSFEDFRNGRFSAYARLGTGYQEILNDDKSLTRVASHTTIAVGGTPVAVGVRGEHETDYGILGYYSTGGEYDDIYNIVKNLRNGTSPLTTFVTPGDSGSPLFAYDKNLKRWLVVGFSARATEINDTQKVGSNYFSLLEEQLVRNTHYKNLAATLTTGFWGNGAFSWRTLYDGVSEISRSRTLRVDVAKGNNLDNGKDLIFAYTGSSSWGKNDKVELILENDINQGAGGLYFLSSGKVWARNPNTTWIGSGVYVENGEQIEWQVKNPSGDRLSKLGRGTLLVNGKGVNQGSISVGDGKVILAQQADNSGQYRAFSKVEIVSGRPTVQLADSNQLNNTKLVFGYRGGKLDMNGNNLKLDRLYSIDDGAVITNYGKQASLTFENDGVLLYQGNIGHSGANLHVNYLPKNHKGKLVILGNVNVDGYVHAGREGHLIFIGPPQLYAGLYDNRATTTEYDRKNRSIQAKTFFGRHNGIIEGAEVD